MCRVCPESVLPRLRREQEKRLGPIGHALVCTEVVFRVCPESVRTTSDENRKNPSAPSIGHALVCPGVVSRVCPESVLPRLRREQKKRLGLIYRPCLSLYRGCVPGLSWVRPAPPPTRTEKNSLAPSISHALICTEVVSRVRPAPPPTRTENSTSAPSIGHALICPGFVYRVCLILPPPTRTETAPRPHLSAMP